MKKIFFLSIFSLSAFSSCLCIFVDLGMNMATSATKLNMQTGDMQNSQKLRNGAVKDMDDVLDNLEKQKDETLKILAFDKELNKKNYRLNSEMKTLNSLVSITVDATVEKQFLKGKTHENK